MEIRQPEFGRRLKQLRLSNGLKQAELAGGPVSASYVSRLEGGARLPSSETLHHLADRLGVDVEELLSAMEVQDSWKKLMAQVSTALVDRDYGRVIGLLRSSDQELLAEIPEEWAWQMLWALSYARSAVNDQTGRAADLRQLVALTRKWQATSLLGWTLVELSTAERQQGNIAEALICAQEAVALVRESPDDSTTPRIKALLALVAAETESGLLAGAGGRIPELLALAERVPRDLRARVFWACSGVRVRQGELEEGKILIDRALATLESRHDLLSWSRLRVAAVSLHLRCGGPRDPGIATWLDEAANALHYVGEPVHQAELTAVVARVHFAEGRWDKARDEAVAAEESGLLAFQDRLRTRLLRGEAALRLGCEEEGIALMREVAEEAERASYLDLAAEAWKTVAISRNDVSRPG